MNTTKERILEAAKICPDVEHVMRILFPEAFKENLYSWFNYISYCRTRCSSRVNLESVMAFNKPEGEFKLGDIVEAHNVSDSDEFDGKLGKVVVTTKSPGLYGVDFQESYADGHHLDGKLPGKTGWFIRNNQLKLIFRDKTPSDK